PQTQLHRNYATTWDKALPSFFHRGDTLFSLDANFSGKAPKGSASDRAFCVQSINSPQQRQHRNEQRGSRDQQRVAGVAPRLKDHLLVIGHLRARPLANDQGGEGDQAGQSRQHHRGIGRAPRIPGRAAGLVGDRMGHGSALEQFGLLFGSARIHHVSPSLQVRLGTPATCESIRLSGANSSQITLRIIASYSRAVIAFSGFVSRRGIVPCREHCKCASRTRGKSNDVCVSALTKLSRVRNSSVSARPYGRSTLQPTLPRSLEKTSAPARAGSPASSRPIRSSTPRPTWNWRASEFESQAKATRGKAGMAGVNGPVRRSTAGEGLRVGV